MPLPKAVGYGEEVRKQYRRRISDQIVLENSVGVGLISAAAASFGLAALSEAPEVILGLGSAGAAAYVGAKSFASKLQQTIYAAGAGAISCSIAAMAPRRAAYASLPELKELIEGVRITDPPTTALASLRADIDRLQALLDKYTNSELRKTTLFIEAEVALTVGRSAERRGKDAIAALENAGAELMGAVTRIEEEVDREIIAARPDLSALMASLSQVIPTAAGQITEQVPTPAASVGTGHTSFGSTEEQKQVPILTKAITDKSRRINILADRVGDQPPAAALALCKVDVQSAGLTFALDQTGDIAVDATKGDQIVTVNASGGTPPYSADWSGVTPPNEKITQNVEDRYSGRVVVKIKRGAPSGKFTLSVKDASKGSGRLTLDVVGGIAEKEKEKDNDQSVDTTAVTETSDTAVERIQKSLLADPYNIKTVNVEKELKIDGIWGEITRAAIITFLKTKNIDPIPTDKPGLIERAQKELKLTDKAEVIVERIQETLRADPYSIKTVNIEKELKADGIWNDITKAAIITFLKTKSIDPMPTDKPGLIQGAQKELGITN